MARAAAHRALSLLEAARVRVVQPVSLAETRCALPGNIVVTRAAASARRLALPASKSPAKARAALARALAAARKTRIAVPTMTTVEGVIVALFRLTSRLIPHVVQATWSNASSNRVSTSAPFAAMGSAPSAASTHQTITRLDSFFRFLLGSQRRGNGPPRCLGNASFRAVDVPPRTHSRARDQT